VPDKSLAKDHDDIIQVEANIEPMIAQEEILHKMNPWFMMKL
jgi:hypothetical protein